MEMSQVRMFLTATVPALQRGSEDNHQVGRMVLALSELAE
jgi:hypothetical protein